MASAIHEGFCARFFGNPNPYKIGSRNFSEWEIGNMHGISGFEKKIRNATFERFSENPPDFPI
jgi:hypothetical protein